MKGLENQVQKNEYIELIKQTLIDRKIKHTLKSENFHGPHWEINFETHEYKVRIYGDIGFDVIVSKGEDTFSLWRIDRSLIGKQKTNVQNLKDPMVSLFELIGYFK